MAVQSGTHLHCFLMPLHGFPPFAGLDYCMTLCFREPPRKKETQWLQNGTISNLPIDNWLEGKVAYIDSIIGWKNRHNLGLYFIELSSNVVIFGFSFKVTNIFLLLSRSRIEITIFTIRCMGMAFPFPIRLALPTAACLEKQVLGTAGMPSPFPWVLTAVAIDATWEDKIILCQVSPEQIPFSKSYMDEQYQESEQ